MADVSVIYTLTPSGGGPTVFNDGVINDWDTYYSFLYLTEIQGLDGAPIRAPIDNAPQQHGGLRHNFWKGGRHVLVTGLIIVHDSRQSNIQIIRNQWEDQLRVTLEACLQAEATWTWMPPGQGARTLNVVNEIPLECSGVVERRFTFGLYAADPDWVEVFP